MKTTVTLISFAVLFILWVFLAEVLRPVLMPIIVVGAVILVVYLSSNDKS